MRPRSGYALPELLVTLTLGAVVLGALAAALAGAERAARGQADRIARAEALRIVAAALGGELRALDPAEDLYALAADSLALRAFRGSGVVCALSGAAVLLRYRGLRDAEPAKDSVLALAGDGAAVPLPLATVAAVAAGTGTGAGAGAAAGCDAGPGETLQRWEVGGAVSPGTLLLVFESGSYHLAAGALRYRRGAAGRQPLTPEVIDHAGSVFLGLGAEPARAGLDALEVRLALEPGAGPREERGERMPKRFLIGFLNRAGDAAPEGGR